MHIYFPLVLWRDIHEIQTLTTEEMLTLLVKVTSQQAAAVLANVMMTSPLNANSSPFSIRVMRIAAPIISRHFKIKCGDKAGVHMFLLTPPPGDSLLEAVNNLAQQTPANCRDPYTVDLTNQPTHFFMAR